MASGVEQKTTRKSFVFFHHIECAAVPWYRANHLSARNLALALKVKRKEVVHAVPSVQQDMRSGEIVEFAWIHHVRKEITFALFECFVDEPNGLEVRNIDVGRAVKHEQGALQPIDMRNR